MGNSKNLLLICLLCVTLYLAAEIVIDFIFNNKLNIPNGTNTKTISFYYWPRIDNEISCYGSMNNDALQSVEDFNPKTKSIFFHETSCRGGVDSRQACAIESAARANPDWEVYLLFNSPVSDVMLKRSCLVKLLQYPNVRVARIHIDSFSKESAVQQIVSHDLRHSRFPVEHSADILRILTLQKWGGVYLDLSMLVVKSFNTLPQNWIAKYTCRDISSGAMGFSKDGVGQIMTSKILEEISETYNPYGWSVNGAYAIRRVLLRRCKSLIQRQEIGDCEGVQLLNHKEFFSEHFSDVSFLTQPLTDNLTSWFNFTEALANYYTYHVKGLKTNMYVVDPNSAYAKLAAIVCPEVYHAYGDVFGF